MSLKKTNIVFAALLTLLFAGCGGMNRRLRRQPQARLKPFPSRDWWLSGRLRERVAAGISLFPLRLFSRRVP